VNTPRFWLKAFWGFDPEHEGYLGFTQPGGRRRLLDAHEPGDLVLIYGADSTTTAAQDRRQVLGVLEIVPEEIRDTERMSDTGRQRKADHGWAERWTYAVPVSRAWRFRQRVRVGDVFPDTYIPKNSRVLGSLGLLVSEREAENILGWPVVPVSVFDEHPIDPLPDTTTFEQSWRPSAGPRPTFHRAESHFEDTGSILYLMVWDAEPSLLLGGRTFDYIGRCLVKVGRTNDPERRLSELNSGFPPAAIGKWKALQASKKFPNSDNAHDAETELKSNFASRFKSLGGEFFLCERKSVESAFSEISGRLAFKISPPS
jgi:hypothetical protein